MDKLFLDANIWFTAARSPQGGSGYIVMLAKKGRIKLVISGQILSEVEKNLRKKENNSTLLRHFDNLSLTKPKLILIGNKNTNKYIDLINVKDAPVVAGAIQSGSDYLVTLDKKHFFTSIINDAHLPIKIVIPEIYLKKFLKP